MFETQKSRNKTSSGDIGLNIRTLASPKVLRSTSVDLYCFDSIRFFLHLNFVGLFHHSIWFQLVLSLLGQHF